jgi:hypothetical protein
MRAVSLLIAAAALPCQSAAARNDLRRQHLRTKRGHQRQLQSGEYRLMRAPKIIDGMKKTRIGSRDVDRDGITVKVSDDGSIGVTVDVDVGVDVSVGGSGSDETGEPECIEWETAYIVASSKSSKSSSKSGKGSKGGKSSKSAGKSAKMIPLKKCVAYSTDQPTAEPVSIVTPSPSETEEMTTQSVRDQICVIECIFFLSFANVSSTLILFINDKHSLLQTEHVLHPYQR